MFRLAWKMFLGANIHESVGEAKESCAGQLREQIPLREAFVLWGWSGGEGDPSLRLKNAFARDDK
jgi:hypothetical protein